MRWHESTLSRENITFQVYIRYTKRKAINDSHLTPSSIPPTHSKSSFSLIPEQKGIKTVFNSMAIKRKYVRIIKWISVKQQHYFCTNKLKHRQKEKKQSWYTKKPFTHINLNDKSLSPRISVEFKFLWVVVFRSHSFPSTWTLHGDTFISF